MFKTAGIVVLIISGFILRYQRVVNEIFWGEEVIYLSVYRNLSLVDLALVKHWLIDHPQLYLIFMHYWSLVSTSIFWLRIPSLLAYLVSAYFLYRLSALLFNNYLMKILILASYTLLPYYIGIEWQAVPYSFAIMFCLMTIFCLIQIIFGQKSIRYVYYLGISLTLFLYTSFESIYFVVGLVTYICAQYYTRNISGETLKKICIGLLISFIAFSPEIIIVLSRVGEFASLTAGLVGRSNSVLAFFSGLLILPKSIVIVSALVILALRMLSPDYFGHEMHKKVFSLFIYIFSFAVILMYFLSELFFEVRHPRAYYFLIITAAMSVAMILDKFYEKGRVYRLLVFAGIAVIVTRFFMLSTNHSLNGWYLYSRPYAHVVMLRDELQSLIKESRTENKSVLLLLDENIRINDWYEGVYLYDYYFKCLDINSDQNCSEIRRAVTSEHFVTTTNHQVVIGVMVSKATNAYFVRNVCPAYLECYVWDFHENTFRKNIK